MGIATLSFACVFRPTPERATPLQPCATPSPFAAASCPASDTPTHLHEYTRHEASSLPARTTSPLPPGRPGVPAAAPQQQAPASHAAPQGRRGTRPGPPRA